MAERNSQLIVRRNGRYPAKDAVLNNCIEVIEIPRAENSRPDWLANHVADLQELHGYGKYLDV